MDLFLDSILVQEKRLSSAELGDRIVVMSLRAGAYFDFNRVGTEIWRMLAEPCPIGRIFDDLCEVHCVDRETLSRDVMPFLQTLLEQRLVRRIAPEAMK